MQTLINKITELTLRSQGVGPEGEPGSTSEVLEGQVIARGQNSRGGGREVANKAVGRARSARSKRIPEGPPALVV